MIIELDLQPTPEGGSINWNDSLFLKVSFKLKNILDDNLNLELKIS